MPRYLLGVLLLLLVSVSEMQAQGDVVLYIEGKPVYRSEFEYYYRKAPEQTPEAYLPAFINYKLKVRYAMDSGLDTVSAFRRQLSFYEGRLVKSYVVDAGMEEQEARFIYERNKQRLQTNDWVRIAHISKYLPQNATPAAEQAAQAVMDSIYSALRSGADFSLLARRYSDDADSRQVGGLLPWMPVNKNMQEWVNKLTVLEKNKISVPFYSPLGLHIVKWVERKPFASYHDKKEEIQAYMEHGGVCSSSVRKDVLALYRSGALAGKYPDWALRLQEVHDGLLVSYIHAGGKIGVLVEADTANATDAVKECLKNVAMQIAALNPKYLSSDDVDAEYKEHEKEILLAQAKNDPKNANKPDEIIEKMITGRLNKELKEVCLLEQEYVKAENKENVKKYVESVAKAEGVSINLKSFVRFETGEGLEKKEEDFAAEVAAQMGN